jgi:hypothetical protein
MSTKTIHNLSKTRIGLALFSFTAMGFTCYIGAQGMIDMQKLSWIGKDKILGVTSTLLITISAILMISTILKKIQEKQLYGANYKNKVLFFDILKNLILPSIIILSAIIFINFAQNINNEIKDLVTKISTIKNIVKIPELSTALDTINQIETTINPIKLNVITLEIKNALTKINEYANTLRTVENAQSIDTISKFVDQMQNKLDKLQEANNNMKIILTAVFAAILALALYKIIDFTKNFIEAKYKDKETCIVEKDAKCNYQDIPSIFLRAFMPTIREREI